MLFTQFNYYEVVGTDNIVRQSVSSTKDIKERKPVEKLIGKTWKTIPWEEWCEYTLSYIVTGNKSLWKDLRKR